VCHKHVSAAEREKLRASPNGTETQALSLNGAKNDNFDTKRPCAPCSPCADRKYGRHEKGPGEPGPRVCVVPAWLAVSYSILTSILLRSSRNLRSRTLRTR
jgi:hypothetical protein